MRNTIKNILCSAILFSGSSVLSLQTLEDITESSFLPPIKLVRFFVHSMQGDVRKLTGIFEEDQKYLRGLTDLYERNNESDLYEGDNEIDSYSLTDWDFPNLSTNLPDTYNKALELPNLLSKLPDLLNNYEKALEYYTLYRMRTLASSFEPFFFCNLLENSKLKLNFSMPKVLSYIIFQLLGKEHNKITNFVFNNLRLSFVRCMISEPFSKMLVSDEDKKSLMIVKKIVENWDGFVSDPRYQDHIEIPSLRCDLPCSESLKWIDEKINEAKENNNLFINLDIDLQQKPSAEFIQKIAQLSKNIKNLKWSYDPDVRIKEEENETLAASEDVLSEYIKIGDFPHSLTFNNFKMSKEVKIKKENDTLKHLSFQDCDLDGDTFLTMTAFLNSSIKLEAFSIKEIDNDSPLCIYNTRNFDSFSKAIGQHDTLTKLTLKQISFKQYNAKILLEELKKNQHIKTFKIGGGTYFSDISIDDDAALLFLIFLKDNTSIESLYFNRGLADESPEQKRQEIAKAIIDTLKENKNLTSLEYILSDRDAEYVDEITVGISESQSIQKLILRRNTEDSRANIALNKLLTALKNNTTLTSLNAGDFYLDEDKNATEDDVNSLNNLIKKNKKIIKINIGSIFEHWNSKKITNLFDALSENKTLLKVTVDTTLINLEEEEIFQAFVQSIPMYLKTNQSIRSFAFWDKCLYLRPDRLFNSVQSTVKIFEVVFEALKNNTNSKIEHLQLFSLPDKETIQKIKDVFRLTQHDVPEFNDSINLEAIHKEIGQIFVFEPIASGIKIKGRVKEEPQKKQSLKRKRN